MQGQWYGPWNYFLCLDPHQRLWFSQDPCNYFRIQMIIFLTTYFSQTPPTFFLIRPSYQYFSSSGLPARLRSLSFTSHGVLQDNKVFLPGVTQLQIWPDPDELRWVRPKKSGRAHDSSSSGSPPLLVTHGNQLINTHTRLQGDSNVPGCPCPLVAGVWQFWGGQLWIYTL